jgi:hypothetical protein
MQEKAAEQNFRERQIRHPHAQRAQIRFQLVQLGIGIIHLPTNDLIVSILPTEYPVCK